MSGVGLAGGGGWTVGLSWGASCDSGMCEMWAAACGATRPCEPAWGMRHGSVFVLPLVSSCSALSGQTTWSAPCWPSHAGRRHREHHRRLQNYTDSTSTWELGAPSSCRMINESSALLEICVQVTTRKMRICLFRQQHVLQDNFLSPSPLASAPGSDSSGSPGPTPWAIVGSGHSLTPLWLFWEICLTWHITHPHILVTEEIP